MSTLIFGGVVAAHVTERALEAATTSFHSTRRVHPVILVYQELETFVVADREVDLQAAVLAKREPPQI